ncbi:N-6 DNA methylase [Salinigranum marinum]|uniref:N-6 DNA methylase n=1 Tax=Salinigranum marinum TaxID=1515595 RepID=UPI00298A0656|nr:N-6 DNA methylase [Salinigranum marinum]
MSEADIHFDFYAHLKSAINEQPNRGAITYGDVRAEYSDGISGRADIVVFDNKDDPVFVVEAKRPEGDGSRETDPYAADVVRQAFGYAGDLGAPFFCTYNQKRMVVFDAFEEGVPLLERSQKSYIISDPEEFAGTLLDEIARLSEGAQKWDAVDDVFIERVNTLHEFMAPRVEDELEDHLEEDDSFQEDFSQWTAAQGIEYDPSDEDESQEVRREFAEQAAYLIINKVIFYKILEDSPTYSQDIDPLAPRPNHVQDDLEEYFTHLVEEVDFEAIYEHDDIYSEIPLDSVESKLRAFINELDDYDLSQFNSDVIGRIYEGVIPAERRRAMGEYYTPPAICDLITRLTIQSSDDDVLDPACGSGGFLVSAYHRLRNNLPESTGSHDHVLSHLSGVEINRFPAHLTAINLAIQDLSAYTDEVDIEIKDFFDVKKYQLLGEREMAGASGSESEGGLGEQRGGYDAVVGNPPYIPQDSIDDKDKVRDHLTNAEIDADYISSYADIYAYFITHSTEFLSEGGDFGFITSDRWLDTQYGEDVQQFILDHYEVRAVIKFDRQLFDDALVDSSILILRKQSDESERDSNVAKFLRIKQELSLDEIAAVVEQDEEPNKLITNDDYRLVTRKQAALHHEAKWNVFFFAPPLYFDLDAHENVVDLGDIAEVSRGITTGANPFYFDHTEDFHELGLEPYTSHALKATGQVDTIKVTDEDASEWSILDVHEYVDEATEDDAEFGTTGEQQVKGWLEENDHSALLEYIEWGEDNGYHDRPTTRTRDIWFDLGNLPRPKILSTMFTWTTHRVFWNNADAPTSDQFYYVAPHGDVDQKLLGGLLNSRVVWLSNELKGRRAGGQGMTRLQTKVYETELWKVPNPREFDDETTERIKSAFDDLMEAELAHEEPTHKDTEEERDKLDQAVMETLGMGDRLDELKASIDAMLQMREEGAGELTTVLVGREARREADSNVVELPGVAEARESTTLDDF